MIELKGKPLTLGAKIFAAVIAIVGLVLKATAAPSLNIDDVLKVAGFIFLIFSPIDVSMWLEKICKVKGENSEYPDSSPRADSRRVGTGCCAEKQPREGRL
mgnify:CR=1 FL=1